MGHPRSKLKHAKDRRIVKVKWLQEIKQLLLIAEGIIDITVIGMVR